MSTEKRNRVLSCGISALCLMMSLFAGAQWDLPSPVDNDTFQKALELRQLRIEEMQEFHAELVRPKPTPTPDTSLVPDLSVVCDERTREAYEAGRILGRDLYTEQASSLSVMLAYWKQHFGIRRYSSQSDDSIYKSTDPEYRDLSDHI